MGQPDEAVEERAARDRDRLHQEGGVRRHCPNADATALRLRFGPG
jgi:hypothetical protein